MSRRFIAAAVQICSGADKEANLGKIADLVRLAAARGAALVVLPEVAAWRGPRDEEASAAEPVPGPTTERLAALARSSGVYLVGGSMLERVEDGDPRPYNTVTAYDPNGRLIAAYRKIHLFDVDLPGRVRVMESETRRAGTEPVCVRTELGVLGLAVCYDLRFPELFRRLTESGAQILAVPSAFTFPTGAAHWEVLVRARAIENQAWVVAPDQTGRGPGRHEDYGHSLIVDPWGVVAAGMGRKEGVILAEIDLEELFRIRRELPCLEHRRLKS